ncbi:PAS domain S-box protein [Pelomyxa schiedti]|nr:PAS domain S-box protein [Pelomyxa schiedti]
MQPIPEEADPSNDPAVQKILRKKEKGKPLTVQEAGKLGGKGYKAVARAAQLGGEEDAVEDILRKKEAGEPLTPHERGKLGGAAYKAAERAEATGGEKETIEEIQEKRDAGEKLTARERGKLGGAKVQEAFRRAREESGETVPTILYVVQVLQLFSLALHPYIFACEANDNQSVASLSSHQYGVLKALGLGVDDEDAKRSYLAYFCSRPPDSTLGKVAWYGLVGFNWLRGSLEYNVSVYIIMVVIAAVYNSLFLMQFMMIFRGAIGRHWAYGAQKFILLLGPTLALMLWRAYANAFARVGAFSSALSTAISIIGIVCFLLIIWDYSHAVLFVFDFRPSWGFMASSTGRLRFVWGICKFMLTLSEEFLLNYGGVLTTVHCIFVWLCSTFLLLLEIYCQVYFSRVINYIEAAILSTLTWFSLCMVAGSFLHTLDSKLILLGVALGCALPACGFGVALSVLWQRRMNAKLNHWFRRKNDRESNTESEFLVLPNPFQYSVVTKFVYSQRTSEKISRAEVIFQEGLKVYPKSVCLLLQYAIFLAEVKQDMHGMMFQLRRARELNTWLDNQYLVYCMSKSVEGRDSVKEERGIHLMVAKHHHVCGKRKITEFWTTLKRNQSSINAQTRDLLLQIVADLDMHEKAAISLFQNLLSDDGKDPETLRQYAQFLIDICDDHEQAEQLYSLADQFDSTATRPAKHHKEVKVLRLAPPPPPIPKVVVSDQLDNESSAIGSECQGRNESIASSSVKSAQFSKARSKILQYRNSIETAKPYTTKSLYAYSILSQFVIVASIFVLFILYSKNFSMIKTSFTDMEKSGDALCNLHHGFAVVREQQSQVFWLQSVEPLEVIISNGTSNWETSFRHVTEKDKWPTEVTAYFPEYYVDQISLECQNGYYKNESAPLYELVLDSFYLLDLLRVQNITSQFLCNSHELRFLLDNVLQHITPTFRVFFDYFNAHALSISDRTAVSSLVITCLCVTICAFLWFVVLLRGFFLISNERNSALSLFADVPKSTLTNIVTKLSSEEERLQIESKQIAKTTQRIPTLLKLGIVLTTSVGVTLAMCLCLFSLGIASLSNKGALTGLGETGDDIVSDAYNVQMLVGTLSLLNTELVVQDETTWESGQLLTGISFALNATETSLSHLRNSKNEEMYKLLHDQPCPDTTDFECTGLDSLLTKFLVSTSTFAQLQNHSMHDPYYLLSCQIYMILDPWLHQLTHVAADVPMSSGNMITYARLLALLSIPIAILGYIFSIPFINSVKRELTRTLRLLLMVPADVLMSISSIHDFLESGCTNITASLKTSTRDQERRTQSLLEGSKDAVLVTDANGVISIFNPAAEALFGYRADEVLGKDISMMFSEEDAQQHMQAVEEWADLAVRRHAKKNKKRNLRKRHSNKVTDICETSFTTSSVLENNKELSMTHKDGTSITVLLSTSASSLSANDIVFASFIKDIRQLKNQQAELEKQKRRADELLLNVLPAPVVEDLKQLSGSGKVVAQFYKEVTILFADIVNFTPMASSMDPHELVNLLNDLFSQWDQLCVKYGIEKIKTIGDAFMACSGLPIPCEDHASRMIEFALAVLRSTAAFNKQRGPSSSPLSVRIGVNTGSVVAGVIGTIKFQYDLWGDSVNLAARLESTGIPNRIQVGPRTHEILCDSFTWESRGKLKMKGKGEVPAYVLCHDPSQIGSCGELILDSNLTSAASIHVTENPIDGIE